MSFTDLPAQLPINPAADRYALAALAASREAAASLGSRLRADIAYGPDCVQRIDVCLPSETGERSLPVLVFLHGGGWTHGHKEWCTFMAPPLVTLPCLFVSVSYRLIPAVSYPAPVDDAVAALRWVHDQIAAFGGAPDRLFVGGHSAGAHIAALIALDRTMLAAAGVPPAALRGCFCLSGTLHRRMVNSNAAPDHVPPGDELAIRPDSPLARVESAFVPFHLCWGSREPKRVGHSNRLMEAALRRAGHPVETMVLPELDHFESHLQASRADNPWVQAVRHRMSGST